MAFTTAISGLKAAANNLAVTGNNIANANTTGFKKSRSEFADVYASVLGGVGTATGSGVKVANVAQQFDQANLQFTENNLDLAVSGEGFFTLAKSVEINDINDKSYTRAGEFKLDKDGFIVNNQGRALLAYKPNGTEIEDGFSTGLLQTLQINTVSGQPKATDSVEMGLNLDQSATTTLSPTFDPTDTDSFNNQSSITLYDSFGDSHVLTNYYVNRGLQNDAADPTQPQVATWHVYHYIDGTDVTVNHVPVIVDATASPPTEADFATLQFDSVGNLKFPIDSNGVADGDVDLAAYNITALTGADPIDITPISYSGTTQYVQKFSVNSLSQNGLPAGQLTGIEIDDDGIILARFSNGGARTMGQVALTRFSNPQGLVKLGDTNWGQSATSGEPIPGEPGSTNFGVIQSGSLEASNVDLAAQLVNLIVAQQSYQANAQTITTENSIMQTILNI